MDLIKLFQIQKELDDRIVKEKGLEGQHLWGDKALALQVELGELANEWRGFKFWSNDQKPRIKRMLEEYVDCFHFVLSIGLDMGIESSDLPKYIPRQYTISDQFKSLMAFTNEDGTPMEWEDLLGSFLGLGHMLGFTFSEIEKAYLKKNEINHQRQEEGY